MKVDIRYCARCDAEMLLSAWSQYPECESCQDAEIAKESTLKIQVDKRLLGSLVGAAPKTAVQLWNDYQRCFESFVALDQIQEALDVLVADQKVLTAIRAGAVEVSIYYRDVSHGEKTEAFQK